ncbi:hypothetical protein [Ventosimonas gracilis]|uniref:hypothetical protein n=1 Tax=Ventosimonas gracilis TaxID=1680762 RepID=UPI001365F08A|nr:hypothetical protein [Ventosimonas gracilis]
MRALIVAAAAAMPAVRTHCRFFWRRNLTTRTFEPSAACLNAARAKKPEKKQVTQSAANFHANPYLELDAKPNTKNQKNHFIFKC